MLWAAGIITVIFTYVNMSQITPNDFWWHMAVGRDIVINGQIPAMDVYSYTMAGQPYLSYQMFWLMDIWLYGWFSLGGAELILFIQSLIITATYLIVFTLCWQNSHKWGIASFCLLFSILLGIYAWSVRPQDIHVRHICLPAWSKSELVVDLSAGDVDLGQQPRQLSDRYAATRHLAGR
jgi:hypothetical protein